MTAPCWRAAEKKALNKLGVRAGGRAKGRRGSKGKKAAKAGNCGGNACGQVTSSSARSLPAADRASLCVQPHRVKLNANTEIIIGKPKNTLPAKK
jgi:hypothetical protein